MKKKPSYSNSFIWNHRYGKFLNEFHFFTFHFSITFHFPEFLSPKQAKKLEDQRQQQNPIHFKAKIPITVFGLPFISAFSATHHHHSTTAAATTSDNLSLSPRTHILSGPSLKLSYNTPTTTPTATTTAASAATTTAPLTLTLKSGVSLSGSTNNSPLIISADFSFSPLKNIQSRRLSNFNSDCHQDFILTGDCELDSKFQFRRPPRFPVEFGGNLTIVATKVLPKVIILATHDEFFWIRNWCQTLLIYNCLEWCSAEQPQNGIIIILG